MLQDFVTINTARNASEKVSRERSAAPISTVMPHANTSSPPPDANAGNIAALAVRDDRTTDQPPSN